MLRPSYKVQLGSSTIDPNSSDDISIIIVDLSMDVPSNLFECSLRTKDKGQGFEKGESVTVQLGYDEDITEVFKGSVDTFDKKFSKVITCALSSMINLCELRIDRFYEQQSAGAIVKDLCGAASVDTDEVSDGIHLPYFAADSNKNAYEHIRDLSILCGFDVYVKPDNKLVFKKFESKEKHLLEYGKNIIRIAKVEQKDLVKSVQVFGESPSSVEGSDTSHWLTKDPVQGVAGNSNGYQVIVRSRVVRDEDTAKKVAEANLDRIRSSVVVIMLDVVGNPKIMLGDAVKIQGVPDASLNGEYQIRSIEHYLSKSAGFTTTIKCRGEEKK